MNDHAWHYVRAGMQHGPVELDTLVSVLRSEPEPRRVKVWREGLADWIEAGELPELAPRLPPAVPAAAPPPVPPFAHRPPVSSGGFSPPPRASSIVDQVEQVATLYRQLVGAVGVQLVLGCAANGLLSAAGRSEVVTAALLALAVLGVALAVSVYLAVTAYRLARAMEAGAPFVWAIALFVPLVSLLALVLLSSKANDWCVRHGLRVGLLGPTRESIEELRRRG